nr:ORF6N domain-containing protein [Providencia rettgeri]ELR5196508.1 ORF6N domain-containing protein [Providencia rettgeri]
MSELITIDANALPVIEWEGKRVITLAMIDELHNKAKNSSRVTLTNHRSKFKLGQDAYLLKGKKELNSLPKGTVDPKTNALWIITESGYLIFIKIMRDDLAWNVHKNVVATYFTQNKVENFKHDD